ncbi:hypothetical protein ACHOLT_11705 [Desulfitobacterium sp. Sab5]|uniref:hypothetical protein n=1 Tax=Desulfitobacterium nosdiversum TaxID=3375356 RepID=UPI003CEC8739
MDYNVTPTPKFLEDVDYYKHKKHYKKIDDDVSDIVKNLEKGNLLGDIITELKLPDEEDVYKVRSVNSSTNVGKSNGFRIIYYVIKNESEIFLLTIYSKKDQEDIPIKDIKAIIRKYCIF